MRYLSSPTSRSGILTTGPPGKSVDNFKVEEIEAQGCYSLTTATQSVASQDLSPDLPDAKDNWFPQV